MSEKHEKMHYDVPVTKFQDVVFELTSLFRRSIVPNPSNDHLRGDLFSNVSFESRSDWLIQRRNQINPMVGKERS